MENKSTRIEKRFDYIKKHLSEDEINENPYIQFGLWHKEAMTELALKECSFVLSTVSDTGPDSRVMLLKEFDENGFIFFTNYKSNKGMQIDKNNNVCALFFWPKLERQLKISGQAFKLEKEHSLKYFLTRPRGAQISACASKQSSKIPNRAFLEENAARITEELKNKNVEMPDFWGGYRLIAEKFEFWQGRKDRLHDRIEYNKLNNDEWSKRRLAP